MKISLLLSLVLPSFALLSTVAQADEPKWRKELSADLVKKDEGKMTITRYDMYKGDSEGEKVTMQVKLAADCPESAGISRDNFVAYTMAAYMSFLQGLAEGDEYSTETMDEPIGKPDLEVNIRFTKDGFQVEGINNKNSEKTNVTQKWSDVFAKK